MPDLMPEEERWRAALENAVFGMWDLERLDDKALVAARQHRSFVDDDT
jgi:hypothetical protein